jgi:hypothetical protein
VGFDYFVGELLCPACGKVSARDGTTGVQTKIRDDAQCAYLGVGARVDDSPRNLRLSDYLELRPPGDGERRILKNWACAFCGTPWNWVMIVIRGGEILEVAAVPMNSKTLKAAHYIDELDASMLAAEKTGRPSLEFHGQVLLDALRDLEE